MPLNAILGNRKLKDSLELALNRGHISHFYLISGPKGSGKHTLARYLAAGILCSGEQKPCLRCDACRKVLAGTHPDLLIIDDSEKKTVGVGLARDARTDMYIMPNESEYKIYCFPRAGDMTPQAQNALLKVLEEPPAYGVFLLLAENPADLLPTIRSRAAELRLQPLPEEILRPWLAEKCPGTEPGRLQAAIARSGGFAGQALSLLEEGETADPLTEAFLDALCAQDALAMAKVMLSMEKIPRDQLDACLDRWLTLIADALAAASGGGSLSRQAERLGKTFPGPVLMEMIRQLRSSREYCKSNVSVAAITACLGWRLTAREEEL